MEMSVRGAMHRIWFALVLPLMAFAAMASSAAGAVTPTASVAVDSLWSPNQKFVTTTRSARVGSCPRTDSPPPPGPSPPSA